MLWRLPYTIIELKLLVKFFAIHKLQIIRYVISEELVNSEV